MPRIALISFFIVAMFQPVQAQGLQGVARVIDGDTIEIAGARIRLFGIDAPEKNQLCYIAELPWHCGLDATRALDSFVAGHAVECREFSRDRYRRVVAVCHLLDSGSDLSVWMVTEGWAIAYRKYSHAYVHDEARARVNGVGIWGSSFDSPAHARKAKRPL